MALVFIELVNVASIEKILTSMKKWLHKPPGEKTAFSEATFLKHGCEEREGERRGERAGKGMFSCCYCCRNLYNSAVSQWKGCASCTLFALLCLCIRTGARTTFLWNNQNSWRQITSKSISALCQCTSKRSTHGHVFFFLKSGASEAPLCTWNFLDYVAKTEEHSNRAPFNYEQVLTG